MQRWCRYPEPRMAWFALRRAIGIGSAELFRFREQASPHSPNSLRSFGEPCAALAPSNRALSWIRQSHKTGAYAWGFAADRDTPREWCVRTFQNRITPERPFVATLHRRLCNCRLPANTNESSNAGSSALQWHSKRLIEFLSERKHCYFRKAFDGGTISQDLATIFTSHYLRLYSIARLRGKRRLCDVPRTSCYSSVAVKKPERKLVCFARLDASLCLRRRDRESVCPHS